MIPPTIIGKSPANPTSPIEGTLSAGKTTASSQRAILAIDALTESVGQEKSLISFPADVRSIVTSLLEQQDLEKPLLSELRTLADRLMILRDTIEGSDWREEANVNVLESLNSIAFWSLHFETLADGIDPTRIRLQNLSHNFRNLATNEDLEVMERFQSLSQQPSPRSAEEDELRVVQGEVITLLGQTKQSDLAHSMMTTLKQFGDLVATATSTDGKSTLDFRTNNASNLALSPYERPICLRFYMTWNGGTHYTPTIRKELPAPKYVIQELFKIDPKDLREVALILIAKEYKERFEYLGYCELRTLSSRRESLTALGTLWNGLLSGELVPVANFDNDRKFKFDFLPVIEAARLAKKPMFFRDATHPLKRARETIAQRSLSQAQLRLLARLKSKFLAENSALSFSDSPTNFVAPNQRAADLIRKTLFESRINPSLIKIDLSENRPEAEQMKFALGRLAELKLLPYCEVSHGLSVLIFDRKHEESIDSILRLAGRRSSHSIHPKGRSNSLSLVLQLSGNKLPEGLQSLNDPALALEAFNLANSPISPSEIPPRAILTRSRNPKTLAEVSSIIDHLTSKPIVSDIETYTLLELALDGTCYTSKNGFSQHQSISDEDQTRALSALFSAGSPLAKNIRDYLLDCRDLPGRLGYEVAGAIVKGITEGNNPLLAEAAIRRVRTFQSLEPRMRNDRLDQVGYENLVEAIAEQFTNGRDEFTAVLESIIVDISKTTGYNLFRTVVLKVLERPADKSPLVPTFIRWIDPADNTIQRAFKQDLFSFLGRYQEQNASIRAALDGARDRL